MRFREADGVLLPVLDTDLGLLRGTRSRGGKRVLLAVRRHLELRSRVMRSDDAAVRGVAVGRVPRRVSRGRLGAVLLALLAAAGCRRPEPPLAIVLVTVDTLRASHLGLYGYDRPTSPFIDSLATNAT